MNILSEDTKTSELKKSCRSLTCKFVQYMLILSFMKLLSQTGSELFTQKQLKTIILFVVFI